LRSWERVVLSGLGSWRSTASGRDGESACATPAAENVAAAAANATVVAAVLNVQDLLVT